MPFRVGAVAEKDKPGTNNGVPQGNWLVIVGVQSQVTTGRTPIEDINIAVFDTKVHADDCAKLLVAAQNAPADTAIDVASSDGTVLSKGTVLYRRKAPSADPSR